MSRRVVKKRVVMVLQTGSTDPLHFEELRGISTRPEVTMQQHLRLEDLTCVKTC